MDHAIRFSAKACRNSDNISLSVGDTAYFILSNNQNEISSQPSTTTSVVVQTAEPASQSISDADAQEQNTTDATSVSTQFADGQYSSSTQYRVPEGHIEDITVSVAVVSDVVESVQVDTVATNGESAEWQAGFDSEIVARVTGQDLDAADVSRLGGASLTSNAFNDVLDAIRNEAQI